MDPDFKALGSFVAILIAWVVVPLLPAWLTFRITPDQQLGLKGPFEGLTLRTSGAFSAYVVVFMLVSLFVGKAGTAVMGLMINGATWTVIGEVKIYDANGKSMKSPPDITKLSVKLLPDPHSVGVNRMTLRIPFKESWDKPDIYLNIPGWGGGRVRLSDASLFDEDPITRVIRLKDFIVLQENTDVKAAIGPSLAEREH